MSTPVSKGFFLFLPGGQSPIARPEPRRFRRLLHLGKPRRFLGTRFPGTSAGYLLRLSPTEILLESYKACHPIQAEHAWETAGASAVFESLFTDFRLYSTEGQAFTSCNSSRVLGDMSPDPGRIRLGQWNLDRLFGFLLPFSHCATQGARNPRMSVLANEDQTSWG